MFTNTRFICFIDLLSPPRKQGDDLQLVHSGRLSGSLQVSSSSLEEGIKLLVSRWQLFWDCTIFQLKMASKVLSHKNWLK